VFIHYPDRLVIGNDVGISDGCQLNAGGQIEIGDGVLIGPCALIWSQNHGYEERDLPIREQGYKWNKVTIEDDVWIGAGAIILPGVCLSRGTVVAAGAVVTRSTECYSIVAGVPAKPLGVRRSRSRCSETSEKLPGEEGAMDPQLS
jgi:acetyltransferase-like isoleucine patch superfamily enzyme